MRSGDRRTGRSATANGTTAEDNAAADNTVAAGQAGEITEHPGESEDAGTPPARGSEAAGQGSAAQGKVAQDAAAQDTAVRDAAGPDAGGQDTRGTGTRPALTPGARTPQSRTRPALTPGARTPQSRIAAGPDVTDQGKKDQGKKGRGGVAVIGGRLSQAGRRASQAGRRLGQAGRSRPAPAAGGAFAQLTDLPVILMMAWLLPGLPLLLAGSFVPAAMLLISVPLAVALVVYGLRRVPGRWPLAQRGASPERRWAAWWGLAGTIAVAAGFGAWQLIVNSASVIVRRDPGAYLQSGYWVAQHGTLRITESLAAFGGAHPGLSFSSVGFFPHGTAVVPSGLPGLPMLVAAGFWIHGLSAAAAMSPVLGALAILAFGGLVGRLAGPQWAPAGAFVLGLTLPEQYTSRSAFSETLMQLLLIGGLCLLIDSLTMQSAGGDADAAATPRGWPRWLTPCRALAALAGLALGLSVLARVDALLYLLPAIPLTGVLVAGRRAQGPPFLLGLVVGTAYGLAGGYLGSRPYMDTLAWQLRLVGLIAAGLAVLTAAGVLLARWDRLRGRLRKVAGLRPVRWLPTAGGVLSAAALVGFAIRPYVQTVRAHANPATAAFVALLQRLEHLPVDPTRTYAEDTLYWVIWYVGAPAVLLGGLGLALLVRRTLRALLTWKDVTGAARNWAFPLAIIGWGAAAVLWWPATVPDQPWASRRLVPLVLPGMVLGAIWASAWLVGRARERGAGTAAWSFVGACCVAALLVPTVVTAFGIGLTHSGTSGSLRLTADGLAQKRTNAGQMDAVRGLCGAIGADATVVILDRHVAQQFTQVIRGMCGVPAGWMSDASAADVRGVLNGISSAGRRPVLLASRPAELARYGSRALKVLDLRTTQDPHTLTQPPTAPWPARYVIWLATPTAPSVGA